jgi:hypothetical protein
VQALYLALDSRRRSFYERGLIGINLGLAIGFALVELRNLLTPELLVASDFSVFWTGWTLILQGRALALYDEAAQRVTQQLLVGGHFEGGLMAFLNPPHAALVSVPFGWLADHVGEHPAFVAWTVGNVVLLGVFVRALSDEWGVTARKHQWMLATAVVGFYPVFCAIKNGQASLLLALAVLGLYRAEKAARHWIGGAWLVVLTIKPQLVPMVVIYLAARRCWRLLGCASAMFAVVLVITALALGPTIWFHYLRNVGALEHFWGSGTPDYMLNIRGALTRMFGLDERVWIDAVSYAAWLAAMVLVAVVLVRRRIDQTDDARPAYAFVIGLALFSNPHLFIHDAVIWTIPLVLYAAAIRDAGGEWLTFAQFALFWPLLFAAASSMNIKSGRMTWVDPHTWLFIMAIVISGCRWPSAAARQTLSNAGRLGPVVDATLHGLQPATVDPK